MKAPRISVCVITYNHEEYLGPCLDSILAQEIDEPYEIVVGEDCSTDGTVAVMNEYARKYPEIVRPLHREKNIGRGGRNFVATVDECRGEYIATLEGDDYWCDKDKLRQQVEFLDQNREYSACFSSSLTTNELGVVTSVRVRNEADMTIRVKDVLQGKFGTNVAVRSLVFRREAFPGFPDWIKRQKMSDKALSVILAQYGPIFRLGKPLAVHRYHPGGVWTGLGQSKQLLYLLRYLTALVHWIDPEHVGDVEIQRRHVRTRLGFALLGDGRWRRGWRYLCAIARKSPRPSIWFWMRATCGAIWVTTKRIIGNQRRRWAGSRGKTVAQ